MRTPFVAGNWKMNLTSAEAKSVASGIGEAARKIQGVEVAICPSFPLLHAVGEAISDSGVALGAQNVFWEAKGAFTGEVSAEMLLDAGCSYVIIGHSERRQYFGETDSSVNRRAHHALDAGLKVILCVGETLDEREEGITAEVIERQVKGGLEKFDAARMEVVVIAYEPVWAIGTGRTATPQQAQDVHQHIRGLLGDLFNKDVAEKTRILYGGSMKAENAAELMGQPDIDGGLVGGASLKVDAFVPIMEAAQ